ncbi:hypothetical protein KO566_13855 [Flavobacteriaceae bacterium XHP0103]|uniref:hypothetical protein n=1 Tax=Marixanthotalea marina TaxID=2844359 RepID=UPI002989E3B3|nr:hypothetical protein [Marixanthotalea marina]MBU3823143.1 hypothetical protein [Marixanthotalea marina]
MSHLYIITKQEFTSLYRFGKIPLILERIMDTENRNPTEINDLVYNSFLSLPHFVGDEEYLIIGFENNLMNGIWIGIEHVSEVIPLTRAAKSSFEMKFDIKLDFKEARFEETVHKVEEHIDIQERYRGAKAFWSLCKVENEYEPLLSNDIIESAYQKRIDSKKSNDFQDDFFIHLLAYDRYEFFPNTDLGYFYDVGEIFAHSKGAPSFRGSGFHSFLENNKHELSKKSLVELAKTILETHEVVKFTEQLTANGLKQYIASAIFLKFKEDLGERETIKDSITGKLIGEIRKDKQFIGELNLAIFLTGSFFGYKKFYDDLYELAGLKIFKTIVKQPQNESNIKDEQIEAPKESKESTTDVQDAEMETTDTTIKHDSEENTEAAPISNSVKVEDKTLTRPVDPSSNEYNGIQKQIFESLLKILDEEKGSFEIKTDRFKDLKKILSPLSVEYKISKKDDVVRVIKDKFSKDIKVEIKGSKYTVSRNNENDLFANS